MKYNLLVNSYIEPNTTIGNVSLSIEDIDNLVTFSGTVTISGSDILCTDCDLGDRIAVETLRYYFSSATASGTVASGISFYYKDDSIDSYNLLETQIGPGYYFATVSGLSAPRYIRLKHTVSSISGVVAGIAAMNDDTVVNFGTDGTDEYTNVLTSLEYLETNDEITTISIYNNGSFTSTAYVMIEPQHDDSDYLLSISDSSSGPWVGAKDDDSVIVNGNLWDNGTYNNTNSNTESTLRLDPGESVGTYITPVFKKDFSKFCHISLNTTMVTGTLVATNANDYVETFEIRSNHTKPIDYAVFRRLTLSGVSGDDLKYRDYLRSTNANVYDSYYETGHYINESTYSHDSPEQNFTTVDNDTQKTAVLIGSRHSGSANYVTLYLLDATGVTSEYATLAYESSSSFRFDLDIMDLVMDANGGVWTYFYSSVGDGGYFIDADGYYLAHFDSSLGTLYKGFSSSDFVTDFDVVYDSGYVWYISKGATNSVVKLSTTGTALVTYETSADVMDLRGLCATSDGGCWVINGNNLYKLNASGTKIDTITGVGLVGLLSDVALDFDDDNKLWIIEGEYVKNIFITGDTIIDFSIYVADADKLHACNSGVWVVGTNGYSMFVGKSSTSIEQTVTHSPTVSGIPGFSTVAYNNPTYGAWIPVSTDPIWNDSLNWGTVTSKNYVLPRESYHQMRLTLRANDSLESPIIEEIYMHEAVAIADIAPGQSKNVYLRISLPDGVNVGGSYESRLKVWWEKLI